MKFVIASVNFFEGIGYNTTHWRKSVNQQKAIVHLDYAVILAKNLKDNTKVQILDATEAYELMKSPEWTDNEGGI
ncbi:hypothetical protein ACWEWU_09550 [Staphylococcus xylosus]